MLYNLNNGAYHVIKACEQCVYWNYKMFCTNIDFYRCTNNLSNKNGKHITVKHFSELYLHCTYTLNIAFINNGLLHWIDTRVLHHSTKTVIQINSFSVMKSHSFMILLTSILLTLSLKRCSRLQVLIKYQ